MQSIGIKELQVNPAKLTRSLEGEELTLITKRSKPIGLAIPFDDAVVTEGLRTALMAEAYRQGYLSLGQVAETLGVSKREAMRLLSSLGVEPVDYEFAEDLETIETLS